MYLTILELSRRDCQAAKLSDAYSVHRIVYSLFPKKDGESRDFLFADKGGDARGRKILILSEREPTLPACGGIQSKPVPESFLDHESYAFEVLLNPVKRDSKSGSLLHIPKDDLAGWLLAKAPSWGFNVADKNLEVQSNPAQRFQKDGAEVVHASAMFKGMLTVSDRGLFKKSFRHGIGRAKGFGFGLLQLVPVKK